MSSYIANVTRLMEFLPVVFCLTEFLLILISGPNFNPISPLGLNHNSGK